MGTGGPLIVEIRTTSGGLPTDTVLATVSLDHSGIPNSLPLMSEITAAELTTIDLSAFNIEVNIDDVLAITLSEFTAGYTPRWIGTPFDMYAAGEALRDPGGGFIPYGTSSDMYFQTFVEPRTIPEPASLALLLAGLAGLGLSRRRTRA